jgi:hypothetical protein
MDEKFKIYCILFDTMPLHDKIIRVADVNNMRKFLHVSGCFTLTALIEMFTGKMPSDYVKKGIGHSYVNRYRDSKSKKIYLPWYEDFIMSKLKKRDWEIRVHNFFPDSIIHGDIHTDSYNGGYDNRLKDIQYIQNNKKKISASKIMDSILLVDDKKYKEWYSRESDFIRHIQKEKIKYNTFYFIYYEHFHSLASLKKQIKKNKINEDEDILTNKAIKRAVDLMRTWDTDEANSIFWIFGDHGSPYKNIIIPTCESYLSWLFLKDNIVNNNIISKLDIISIRDFVPTIMKKFKYDYKNKEESCSLFDIFDKHRVYYVEDGRKSVDSIKSTTALACKVVEWDGVKPLKILQVCYFLPKNKFYYDLNILSKDGFFKKGISLKRGKNKYNDILYSLKKSLVNRFKWIKIKGTDKDG